MPLFEYKCPHCGKSWEDLLSREEAEKPRNCPHCGKSGGERQMSASAISIKDGQTCPSPCSTGQCPFAR